MKFVYFNLLLFISTISRSLELAADLLIGVVSYLLRFDSIIREEDMNTWPKKRKKEKSL